MSMTMATLPQLLDYPEGFQKAHLASDLALELEAQEIILVRHGITEAHLRQLTHENEFNMMLEEFRREWSSPKNVKERIKLKALLATEDGMDELYMIFRNMDLAPNARLDAYKQLSTLADAVPKRETEGGGGSGFQITINVGQTGDSGEKPVVIEASAEVDQQPE